MSDAKGESELPRQELLAKLLRMTASPNDGEALTAMRKANALLASAGWDWDKLLAGKIRIIEDPFKNLQTPSTGREATPSTPFTTNGVPPKRAHAPSAPPPPPPPPKPQTWPLGITPNSYAGFCYCCGKEVTANAGVIFHPSDYVTGAPRDWKLACLPCNKTAHVQTYAASRQAAPKGKRHVSDLA